MQLCAETEVFLPMTFAMVVMPATMVSVLPVGGILVKNGSLSSKDFVMIIILSVGLITPLVTLMSYSDDLQTMGTIFGEVRAILDAPEMVRPVEGKVPAGNDLELKDVRFSYQPENARQGQSDKGSAGQSENARQGESVTGTGSLTHPEKRQCSKNSFSSGSISLSHSFWLVSSIQRAQFPSVLKAEIPRA